MESTYNKKQVFGVGAFAFGVMANNLSMVVLAYVMMSYPGESTTTVQSLLSTPALVGMLFAFAAAPLNRFLSSRTMILFCEITLAALGPIFIFGGGILPIGVLLAAAALMGFGQGAMNVFIGLQMFAAVSDEVKRAALTGIVVGVSNIGGIIYAVLGGAIAGVSWQLSFALPLVFGLFALVCGFICLPKTAPEGAAAAQPKEAVAKDAPAAKGGMGKALLVSVHFGLFFLFAFTFGSNISEYVVTTHSIGAATEAGIASSMVMVGGCVAGFALGGITKVLGRFTGPVMMIFACVGTGLCALVVDNFYITCLGGFLCGLGQFGSVPYSINIMHDVVSHESQYGTAMAIWSGMMNGGMVIAVYVMAFLAQVFFGDGSNVDAKFIIGTVGLAICAITSFPIYLSIKPKGKAAE